MAAPDNLVNALEMGLGATAGKYIKDSICDPLNVTAGTVAASKAVVVDSNKDASSFRNVTVATLTATSVVKSRTFQIGTRTKVGATAGWTVGAANNLPYLATLAASQTGSTLVVPLDGLEIGETITGFRIVAQVESAGGTVTIDADLRATTNVAAEPTDASIGAMTQVSVTADTAVSQAKTGLTEVVTSGKTYYLLVTATTGASTDIILQACEVTTTTV